MLLAIDGRWFHRYPILAAHAIWTILTEIQVSGSPGKNLPGIVLLTISFLHFQMSVLPACGLKDFLEHGQQSLGMPPKQTLSMRAIVVTSA